MNRNVDRRSLLGMGAKATGAALVATLPSFPAMAGADPDNELVRLFQTRVDHEATYVSDDEGGNEEAFHKRSDEIEDAIFAIPAAGFTGLAVKLRVLADFNGDCCPEMSALILADALRLSGVQLPTLPVRTKRPFPDEPLPPLYEAEKTVYASKEEFLTRYACWLAYEHQRLAEEMYPGHPEPWRFIPMDRAAMRFHFPYGRDGRPCEGSSPSGRALAVLSVAGVFTGPNNNFDAETWREGGAA